MTFEVILIEMKYLRNHNISSYKLLSKLIHKRRIFLNSRKDRWKDVKTERHKDVKRERRKDVKRERRSFFVRYEK